MLVDLSLIHCHRFNATGNIEDLNHAIDILAEHLIKMPERSEETIWASGRLALELLARHRLYRDAEDINRAIKEAQTALELLPHPRT